MRAIDLNSLHLKCAIGLLSITIIVVAGCAAPKKSVPTAASVLKDAPRLFEEPYHAPEMVATLNTLRGYGSDRTAEMLKTYLEDTGSLEAKIKVVTLSRLLFVVSNEWGPMPLGQIVPNVDQAEARSMFPMFPFAFSGGIPFFLAKGSVGGGPMGEEPIIAAIRNLPMVKSNFPTSGFEQAAKALVQGEAFRRLYPDPELRKEMTTMVLEQARPRRR